MPTESCFLSSCLPSSRLSSCLHVLCLSVLAQCVVLYIPSYLLSLIFSLPVFLRHVCRLVSVCFVCQCLPSMSSYSFVPTESCFLSSSLPSSRVSSCLASTCFVCQCLLPLCSTAPLMYRFFCPISSRFISSRLVLSSSRRHLFIPLVFFCLLLSRQLVRDYVMQFVVHVLLGLVSLRLVFSRLQSRQIL